MLGVLKAILHLLIGAVFGAMMTFGHQANIELFGVSLPWGLVLACFGAFALLMGYRLLAATRTLAIWAALGMVGAVLLLSLPSAGGSVLIPAGTVGVIWLAAPTVIALFVIGWPRRRRREVPDVDQPRAQREEEPQPVKQKKEKKQKKRRRDDEPIRRRSNAQ